MRYTDIVRLYDMIVDTNERVVRWPVTRKVYASLRKRAMRRPRGRARRAALREYPPL